MLQLSKKSPIFANAKAGFASTKEPVLLYSACTAFVPSFVKNIRLHRGERLSFDPSVNLENSIVYG